MFREGNVIEVTGHHLLSIQKRILLSSTSYKPIKLKLGKLNLLLVGHLKRASITKRELINISEARNFIWSSKT